MPYKAYQQKSGVANIIGNQEEIATMAKEYTFQVGDPVWAKMKGFPHWPGRIDSREKMSGQQMRKGSLCVYFFGSRNYAAIMPEDLKPYAEFKEKIGQSAKRTDVKRAIEELERFLAGTLEESDDDSDSGDDSDGDDSDEVEVLSESGETEKPEPSIQDHNDDIAEAEFEALVNGGVVPDPNTSAKKPEPEPSKAKKRPLTPSKSPSPKKKIKIRSMLPPIVKPAKPPAEAKATSPSDKAPKKKETTPSGKITEKKELTSPETIPKKKDCTTPSGKAEVKKDSTPSGKAEVKKDSTPSGKAQERKEIAPSDKTPKLEESAPPFKIPKIKDSSPPYKIPKLKDSSPAYKIPKLKDSARPGSDHVTKTSGVAGEATKAAKAKIGFLGLGRMGSSIVKKLIESGHDVTVWNRSLEKCRRSVELGAKKAGTAAEVVGRCDIVFSCLADPQSVKDVIFGAGGVLEKITASKGYVEMTGIDSTTSEDVAEAIGLKGGRYLEAQVHGGRSKAADGSLVVLAAGDRGLYEDCSSCFKAVSKSTFYLGKVGNASNMNLVLNSVSGVLLAGLTEGMALGESAGLKPDTFLEVLNQTGLNCSFVTDSVKAVIDGCPPSQQRLGHLQKDLHLTVGLSHHLEVPMPVTAAANEAFKRARKR